MRGDYEHDEEELFVFVDHSPVRPRHVRTLLRVLLKRIGLNEKLYDTHSLRIGRATDLMKQGKTIEEIKRMGRWKSNAVYRYLKE